MNAHIMALTLVIIGITIIIIGVAIGNPVVPLKNLFGIAWTGWLKTTITYMIDKIIPSLLTTLLGGVILYFSYIHMDVTRHRKDPQWVTTDSGIWYTKPENFAMTEVLTKDVHLRIMDTVEGRAKGTSELEVIYLQITCDIPVSHAPKPFFYAENMLWIGNEQIKDFIPKGWRDRKWKEYSGPKELKGPIGYTRYTVVLSAPNKTGAP